MHPLLALEYIKENFKEFILSKYPYAQGSAEHQRLAEICEQEGEVFQEPVLQLDRPRVVRHLASGEPAFFHPKLQKCLEKGFGTKQGPFSTPYTHQYDAWKRLAQKLPTVISTGTGSGKSESFIVPLLDLVLKAKEQDSGKRKLRAIVVYPMNALLEDQHIRFCRFAYKLGLKVGVYNGSFKELKSAQSQTEDYKKTWKTKIFGEVVEDSVLFNLTEVVDPQKETSLPDVLLTNYSMLQYMLLRSDDHTILNGAELEALALDEAHLYSGTLGLEMAALIARLREHIERSGGKTAQFVPMATSATLVRGGDERDIIAMSEFFSGLFSTPFPKDDAWLIKDHYEEPLHPDSKIWSQFNPSSELVATILETARVDVSGSMTLLQAEFQRYLPMAREFAEQLPWILLRMEDGTFNPVVGLSEAGRRYAAVCKGLRVEKDERCIFAEAELLCLLSWLALPRDFANPTSRPLLGLRVHAFTKSEPRIYRELSFVSGKAIAGNLLSESEMQSRPEVVALPVAHCRSCAHESYLAFAVDRGDGTFDLSPVDREPSPDDSVFAFSIPQSFDDGALTSGWNLQELEINSDVGGLIGTPTIPSSEKNTNAKAGVRSSKQRGSGLSRFADNGESMLKKTLSLWRISRKISDKESKTKHEASDLTHCPSCLRAGSSEQMLIKRGSPASDLSVHAQNILAAAEDAKERRLLIFCDNRQDSSFIAGFMSDRHRRLRLRRAVCQTLKLNSNGLPLISANDANVRPFAAAVLNSLKESMGDKSKDGEFKVQTLRAALTSDIFDFNSHSRNDFDEWQVSLLEKVNPASAVEGSKEGVVTEQPISLASNEGRFLMRMLSEAIARDIALGAERQGSLRTLGLVAAWQKALNSINLPARNLAIFLFIDLFEAQAWDEKPKGLEDQRRQFAKDFTLAKLVDDISSRRSHFGKAFRDNEPGIANKLELVLDGEHKDGDKTKVMEWLKATIDTYSKLGFLHVKTGKRDHILELRLENIVFTSETAMFRSALKRVERSVPRDVNLSGLSTGKHKSDEFQGPFEAKVPKAWSKVYLDAMEENNDPFVRAHEHNGMLKPVQAMKAIQKFGTLEFNTLVATPTLEMGIDLPDLPVVAHRSVPPDPSNYAQRAGRAGRDKRRALLLTHCGRGAHDTGYFQEPPAMVSGQIAPPGAPRENTWLLKRHVNAIILQLMAAKGLNLKDWDALIERKDYFEAVYDNDTSRKLKRHESKVAKQNWRALFDACQNQSQQAIDSFSGFLSCGLWASSSLFKSSKMPEELKRELDTAFKNFLNTFQDAIDAYEALLKLRKSKLETLKLEMAERDSYGLRRRLVAELYSNLTNLLPIPFLQSAGFLPNFDFPMDAVRFSGYKRNTIRSKSGTPEVTVEYSRALNSAMREFAPGQRHYAAGHVFTVDRYSVVGQNKDKSLSHYGVCSAGCSILTKLTEYTRTCECSAKLIGSTETQTTALPPILRLSAVQGKTFEFIGDRKDEKDAGRLTSESLVIGDSSSLPTRWHHKQHTGINVSLYESALGTDFGLDIMTVVGSKPKNSDTGTSRSMAPLYRNSPDQDDFSVKAFPDESAAAEHDNDVEGLCIHPFLLGHKFNADAIKIEIKVSELTLPNAEKDACEVQFFETLRAVLVKSIRRELFLSSRSNQLSSFVFKKVVQSGTERRTLANSLYLYDSVPGGSGILPLIRSYWPRILNRAKNIVLSKEKTFDCCKKSCKRCISTYENQSVDKLLDKRILRLDAMTNEESSATIFDLLQGILEHSSASENWEFEKARLTIVDPDEPDFAAAETAFRTFLKEDFSGLKYLEQESLRNELDHEVTRPDFVLKNADSTFHVFVDGYKYHGKASHFFGDLRKRNFIEFRSLGTTVTVPASRVVGKNSNFEELRKKLLGVMNSRLVLPAVDFEKRARFNPDLPEYDIPQYAEYDVLYQQAWKQPVAGSIFSEFKTMQIAGILEATCQAVCVMDPPVLESGFIEKTWWHLFWKEVLDLQQMGVRPVFIVTKVAKQKAA